MGVVYEPDSQKLTLHLINMEFGILLRRVGRVQGIKDLPNLAMECLVVRSFL